MNSAPRRFWRDPLFVVALSAGPLFWALLYALDTPVSGGLWPLGDPLRFLVPALLYPVVEELLFRGVVQSEIHARLRPWRLGPLSHANILTSVLFAALHFIHHPPLWALSVVAPSLVFGYFRERSGGLAAPIALHVTYNSGYFWLYGA